MRMRGAPNLKLILAAICFLAGCVILVRSFGQRMPAAETTRPEAAALTTMTAIVPTAARITRATLTVAIAGTDTPQPTRTMPALAGAATAPAVTTLAPPSATAPPAPSATATAIPAATPIPTAAPATPAATALPSAIPTTIAASATLPPAAPPALTPTLPPATPIPAAPTATPIPTAAPTSSLPGATPTASVTPTASATPTQPVGAAQERTITYSLEGSQMQVENVRYQVDDQEVLAGNQGVVDLPWSISVVVKPGSEARVIAAGIDEIGDLRCRITGDGIPADVTVYNPSVFPAVECSVLVQ